VPRSPIFLEGHAWKPTPFIVRRAEHFITVIPRGQVRIVVDDDKPPRRISFREGTTLLKDTVYIFFAKSFPHDAVQGIVFKTITWGGSSFCPRGKNDCNSRIIVLDAALLALLLFAEDPRLLLVGHAVIVAAAFYPVVVPTFPPGIEAPHERAPVLFLSSAPISAMSRRQRQLKIT
jgi:hypothetical protein